MACTLTLRPALCCRIAALQRHFDLTSRRPEQHLGSDGIQFVMEALQHLLEHDNWETRRQLKELMKDDLFIP